MNAKPRIMDARTAVRQIKRGMRMLIGSGCAEPQHLVSALVQEADHFRDNEIVHLMTMGIAPYAEEAYRQNFRHNAFFIGHNVRKAISHGLADYTPVFLSEIPNLFSSGQLPLHCALIQVTPPDSQGMVSLGVSVDIVHAGIHAADMIIAQVNPAMPETLGKSKIPLDMIDILVEQEEPIIEMATGPLDPVSLAIGERVARLIKDGDTLQLGIGNIPNAILRELADKNDLGIHTEMFSSGFVDLYKNGNITNRKKGLHEGVSITSFILGNRELYDLVHQNPDIQFYPSEYTNDPFVIARNRNMVSVNSAIEVDLTGQICADSMGSNFFSGIGGQVDFVRGARRSQGGRSIIALPSTAKKGQVSRIVADLRPGAGVVTTRGDVHYVATEYGVAYLHGMTVRERALELIQIAHPKFRDELLEQLKERHYVAGDQKFPSFDVGERPNPFSKDFGGVEIFFRDLRPADEGRLQSFFYSHSKETIYQRYFHQKQEMPHLKAQEVVALDYNQDMAIAGFASAAPFAPMVCIGRFITQKDNQSAAITFTVRETFQGRGIATFLMEKLVAAAQKRELKSLYAYVLADNIRMINLLREYRFLLDPDCDEATPLHLYKLEMA